MSKWQPIETATKDGRPVYVKRVYIGKIIYEGQAAWRTVRFGAVVDPISGEQYAKEENATGWMHVDIDKRVPEPTHWRDKP